LVLFDTGTGAEQGDLALTEIAEIPDPERVNAHLIIA
jgi:hypothetical protein